MALGTGVRPLAPQQASQQVYAAPNAEQMQVASTEAFMLHAYAHGWLPDLGHAGAAASEAMPQAPAAPSFAPLPVQQQQQVQQQPLPLQQHQQQQWGQGQQPQPKQQQSRQAMQPQTANGAQSAVGGGREGVSGELQGQAQGGASADRVEPHEAQPHVQAQAAQEPQGGPLAVTGAFQLLQAFVSGRRVHHVCSLLGEVFGKGREGGDACMQLDLRARNHRIFW